MTHAARVSERSAGRFSTSSFMKSAAGSPSIHSWEGMRRIRINAYAKTLRDEAPVLAFRSFHPKAGILFFR